MDYTLHSENIDQIATAMTKVQAALKPATFDSVNPHFKNRYASLGAIVEACLPLLAKNDIAVFQSTTPGGNEPLVVTMLVHKSGQWIKGYYPIWVTAPTPQSLGSGTTYAKRYALAAIVGVVADEDDDGNAASVAPQQAQSKPVATKPQASGAGTLVIVERVKALDLSAEDRKYVEELPARVAKYGDITDPMKKKLWAIEKSYSGKPTQKPAPQQYPDVLDDEIPLF